MKTKLLLIGLLFCVLGQAGADGVLILYRLPELPLDRYTITANSQHVGRIARGDVFEIHTSSEEVLLYVNRGNQLLSIYGVFLLPVDGETIYTMSGRFVREALPDEIRQVRESGATLEATVP